MRQQATLFSVYRWYDAVLQEHNDARTLGKYAAERDESLLTIPAGAKPMLFNCRVLSREQRRRVQELPTGTARRELAFKFGVISVTNTIVNGQTASVTASRSRPEDALSDEALDSLGVGDLDIAEIGEVIVTRSFLATGIEPRYPLLDSSVVAYENAVFHLAARKLDSETAKDK